MSVPRQVVFHVQLPPVLPRFPRSWRYCDEWTWVDEAHLRYGAGRMVRHAENCDCPPPTVVYPLVKTSIEESVYSTLKTKVDLLDALL